MAGKSDFFENAILKLIFENSLIPGVGHTGAVVGTGLPASTTPGKLWVALHTTAFTDNIGETSLSQNTEEVRYATYGRVGVERRRSENGSDGWIVTANQVKPGQPITFPPVTSISGGPQTVGWFSIGTEPSGAGQILYFGTVSPNITLAVGITPQLTVATTITED